MSLTGFSKKREEFSAHGQRKHEQSSERHKTRDKPQQQYNHERPKRNNSISLRAPALQNGLWILRK